MSKFQSTKVIELGSCAFRQWCATSHCRYLHGYQLKAKFWFGASSLDEKNWVVDFAGLKELKATLQHQFDHTLCIAANDPLLPLFKDLHDKGGCDLRVMEGVGIEKTAEWCARAADEFVRKITNNRCWVDQVEVFEHELNSAIYSTQQQLAIDVSQPTPSTEAVVASPVTTPANTQPAPSSSRPAHVGPNNSPGKGDWFKGTSWG
jgi:6-pyruvoyltetrahydropterin/6-carboxytetrahydropterin synthase